MDAAQVGEDGGDLAAGEHDRDAHGFFCALDAFEPAEGAVEDVFVQEHDRAERLGLRGGADVPARREVGQELGDVLALEEARVFVAVELEEAAQPVDVGFDGAWAAATGFERAAEDVD